MDAIYLVLNGQTKGPFTFAQVRDSYARGGIVRETSAWHQGLIEWTTVGALLEAAGEKIKPPTVAAPSAEFTRGRLRHLARSQNMLMWSIAAGLFVYFLAIVLHNPIITIAFWIGVTVFQVYALYNLGDAARMSLVWVLCVFALLPCLGILVLLFVSGRASQILRDHGIRVGLMGGRVDDISE